MMFALLSNGLLTLGVRGLYEGSMMHFYGRPGKNSAEIRWEFSKVQPI
jgi:hypothetical protein